MTNDILVFAEQRDDRIHPGAVQAVTPAKALAAKTGGQVVACLIGDKLDAATDAIDQTGVNRIVSISDPSLAVYSATRYRTALAAAMEKVEPRIVLLPATFMGRDLAPRVAVRTGATVATDVVALEVDGDGALDVRRPVYNGKAFCHVTLPKDKPAIASVRANTFPAPRYRRPAATSRTSPRPTSSSPAAGL
jgi:electron transfer flavoprotein alpha subunit